MFIVWGTRVVYRHVGYAADFCPMCRKMRPFKVTRVGLASHVYYISAGQGKLAGHQRTCLKCGVDLNCDFDRYAAIAKHKASLESLLTDTLPNYQVYYREVLALESVIRRDPRALPPAERKTQVQLPFHLLAPKVEKWFSTIRFDALGGLSLVGAILLFIAVPGILSNLMPSVDPLIGFGIGLGLAAALVLWQIFATRKRFLRREILPALGRTLSPLKPSSVEIRAALAELAREKMRIARVVKPADLEPYLAA